MIARAIRTCERELIIFSGEFHKDVFADPEVLNALRSLEKQSVKLYVQLEEVDPQATAFRELLREKAANENWLIERNVKTAQAHFIVIDRVDCRVEFHNGSTGGSQPAYYFTGRPDFCRKLLRSFSSNVLKHRPNIDRTRLPTVVTDMESEAA